MTGLPVADAPIWSPDGSWIAFLHQDGGRTRLWRAAIDGSGSAPIAAVDSDARDFRFANGATIVLKLDGDVQEARANIEREAQVGFHFDSRFAPFSSSGPYAPVSRSEEHTSELQSLMRTSYVVFCLEKKIQKQITSKNM